MSGVRVAGFDHSIRVPLGGLNPVKWGPIRCGEPIKIGVPIPAGRAFSADQILIDAPFKLVTNPQVRVLDTWPDGSIRWALIDALADSAAGHAPVHAVRVSATAGGVSIDTGVARFGFDAGGSFPFSSVSVRGVNPIDVETSGLRVEIGDRPIVFRIADVRVDESGPVRAEVELRAVVPDAVPLQVCARVELFAGSAAARLQITLHNHRRAEHPNGQWVLGDRGSLMLRSAVLRLDVAGTARRLRCAPEFGLPLADVDRPFEIYQESSGGEVWNAPVHRNRDGRVPLRFRGYRLRSGGVEHQGLRATPIVSLETDGADVTVTAPQFWENFPRAIVVGDRTIEIGLFPSQAADVHELQGGEQKTHTLVVAFAADAISDPPLAWCHDPLLAYPSPDWCCASGAVPFLIPAAVDDNRGYLDLVALALDPNEGFERKRERADEYGWRDFGDLPGDHESAFQPADRPLVSHYNNQYDAIAGFAMHFLRTGDRRWWQLMTDLARHVRDIDIYRTTEDKAAYNRGMFWHTNHYTDAGTATHRTYPRGTSGGGPSCEHNYNLGLMLHYFMTGERASRDTAIDLGRWVIDMDDGRQSIFRWLAGGATGLASATGSMSYHGPGRGAANSILACLVASRLTGAPEYAAKADELIRRCIHPADDIEARHLFDIERRWYYTVFLQVLGMYLQRKHEARQFDEMYEYARASLLHYARWMTAHERPYLDQPEKLEFPTETWAAQDMRKADVFLWAALHADADARARFLERSRWFFEYSVNTLATFATRRFTRPIVLMLSNGIRDGWFRAHAAALPAPPAVAATISGSPGRPFEPQKARAVSRAGRGAILGFLAAIAALFLWIR
jgi:hypothetical protein